MYKPFGLLILAVSLLLSACGQIGLEGQVLPPTEPPTATAAPTNTVPAPTPAATNTPADPAALCPKPGEGQALYLSRDNGFCFLYPAAFSAQPDFLRPSQGVDLNGPGVTKGMDRAVLHLEVLANGPAYGLDTQSYAAKWAKLNHVDASQTPQPTQLNGQPAMLFAELPGGMFNQRQALLVAGGYKYQVTLSPLPDQEPDLAQAGETAWTLMASSLTLFTPAKPVPQPQPDKVCPQPAADVNLWVDEAQGFCLLYPTGFTLTVDVPVAIVGGPVLTDTQSWGQVRTSLTVATYDQPPSQVQPPAAPAVNVDPNSIVTTTIAGNPAVLYDFIGAPWRQRSAEIVANGSRYTMVGPWDAQVLPQGVADAQRLWDIVTKSIVFFDKWH